MSNRHAFLLAGALFVIGFAFFLYKAFVIGLPLKEGKTPTSWDIEVKVTFQGQNAPAKVGIAAPGEMGRYVVVDRSAVSSGYGVTGDDDDGIERVYFSRRDVEGEQALYYRFRVFKPEQVYKPQPTPKPAPADAPNWKDDQEQVAQELLKEIEQKSSGPKTLAAGLLKRFHKLQKDDPASRLLNRKTRQPLRTLHAVADILSYARVTARIAHGLDLSRPLRHARLVHWLEVHDGKSWRGYTLDPPGKAVPAHYMPWYRGRVPLVTASGTADMKRQISLANAPALEMQAMLQSLSPVDKKLLEFSLFQLPIGTQSVYRILLTVPLGVLVLVLLRNVIGVTTFGTFMPVLIALAFRETKLVWGIVLFTSVVSLGLIVRLYLENLKLLIIPRLASVVIVVILTMAAFSIISAKLGFDRGMSVALFPMVILAMTIERMSIVWDERGPSESIKQGIGSIVVATICYSMMSIPGTDFLFLVYPELLLVLLAGCIVLGRYSGYRLTELRRFREFLKRAS